MAHSSDGCLAGGRLVVHFTKTRRMRHFFFRTNRDATAGTEEEAPLVRMGALRNDREAMLG